MFPSDLRLNSPKLYIGLVGKVLMGSLIALIRQWRPRRCTRSISAASFSMLFLLEVTDVVDNDDINVMLVSYVYLHLSNSLSFLWRAESWVF